MPNLVRFISLRSAIADLCAAAWEDIFTDDKAFYDRVGAFTDAVVRMREQLGTVPPLSSTAEAQVLARVQATFADVRSMAEQDFYTDAPECRRKIADLRAAVAAVAAILDAPESVAA